MMTKINVTLYSQEQLPDALKPLAASKGGIKEEELARVLNETAIMLYSIERMKAKDESVTLLDAYRLGAAKGFASLTAICHDYLNGIELVINEGYIIALHQASAPFLPNVLTKESQGCTTLQANELLEGLEFCKSYYMNQIKEVS